MGKLYVVRHGETDFNVQGRYAGSTDVELNDNGIQQAKTIAESLKTLSIDVIIASPLRRAHKTATIIQDQLQKPLILHEEFVERAVGIYEGLTRDEMRERYPDLWNQNVLGQFDCTIHQGESMRQVRERVRKGLLHIKNTYADQNVVLVIHGYVSREVYAQFNNVTAEEFGKYSLGNCQVAEYDLDKI
jgi:probable phosphoglycerate mutase